jgi:hypothetical protein
VHSTCNADAAGKMRAVPGRIIPHQSLDSYRRCVSVPTGGACTAPTNVVLGISIRGGRRGVAVPRPLYNRRVSTIRRFNAGKAGVPRGVFLVPRNFESIAPTRRFIVVGAQSERPLTRCQIDPDGIVVGRCEKCQRDPGAPFNAETRLTPTHQSVKSFLVNIATTDNATNVFPFELIWLRQNRRLAKIARR